MNATTSPLTQALVAVSTQAAANMPNVKALPDLLLMIENYGKAMGKVDIPRGGRLEYWDDRDAPDLGPIITEVERLQCAETDRDQMLEAATGVLLVLSLLAPEIERMGCGAARAVENFSKAVAEAQA